jgi:competence protein ComEC
MTFRRRIAAIAAAGALMLALGGATLVRAPAAPSVTALDIGQGDAILVSIGSTQALVDGGPGRAVLARLGSTLPFFDRRIEYVILTHPDADHVGGLAAVIDRYDVGTIVTTSAEADTADYRAFAAAAGRSGARRVRLAAGDAIALAPNVRLEALWPPAGEAVAERNDGSIVLRLMVDGRPAAILTGDATSATERRLIDDGGQLAAPLLKIGHHGSRSSSSAAFLDAVAPEAAFISVGKNRYGHPAPSVLLRLRSRGIRAYRTDESGDLRAVFGRDGAMRIEVRGLLGWRPAP